MTAMDLLMSQLAELIEQGRRYAEARRDLSEYISEARSGFFRSCQLPDEQVARAVEYTRRLNERDFVALYLFMAFGGAEGRSVGPQVIRAVVGDGNYGGEFMNWAAAVSRKVATGFPAISTDRAVWERALRENAAAFSAYAAARERSEVLEYGPRFEGSCKHLLVAARAGSSDVFRTTVTNKLSETRAAHFVSGTLKPDPNDAQRPANLTTFRPHTPYHFNGLSGPQTGNEYVHELLEDLQRRQQRYIRCDYDVIDNGGKPSAVTFFFWRNKPPSNLAEIRKRDRLKAFRNYGSEAVSACPTDAMTAWSMQRRALAENGL
jgi:hypothetical protein